MFWILIRDRKTSSVLKMRSPTALKFTWTECELIRGPSPLICGSLCVEGRGIWCRAFVLLTIMLRLKSEGGWQVMSKPWWLNNDVNIREGLMWVVYRQGKGKDFFLFEMKNKRKKRFLWLFICFFFFFWVLELYSFETLFFNWRTTQWNELRFVGVPPEPQTKRRRWKTSIAIRLLTLVSLAAHIPKEKVSLWWIQ